MSVPFGAGTAAADVSDVQCGGTQTTTFSPGLTMVPTMQTINHQAIYAPCISSSVPDLTSGSITRTNQLVTSCLDPLESGSGTRTINWNTGQTSTFTYNRTATIVGGNSVAIATGAITAGLFAGDTAVAVVVGPTLNTLDCLQPPGITSLVSAITLTITST